MTRIDAHHHFWNPARGDYGWMPADDPVLSRTYGPADLAPGLAATGIGRTVLVQAAPSVAETDYLLGIADATDHVAAVIGWIDFEDPQQIETLRRLARHPKFRGVRPMIQDIADDDWMLRADVQWAFRAICDLDLSFDCLGFPRHMANFLVLLERYPGMRAVLDHGLKPRLGDADPATFAFWAEGMARLAARTDARCKLSGLVTEADQTPDEAGLRPYSDHILAAFGPERVMWGSDWPVLRLRCEYRDWHDMALRLCAHLSDAGRAAVFAGTAAEFYRI
ncbi:amidohydrolase family protein [Paracoccus mangrovi]|uniref:Amidohydrolase family protein n=1 Tax=Paracoccus mangrovi TaxID=1715645 RepID=A0ABV7QZC3_9RHOB